MPEFQTVIQDSTALFRGSGKLEVAAYQDYPGGFFADSGSGGPEWFDVGAIAELNLEEQWTLSEEEYDNVESEDAVTKQNVVITFNQYEVASEDVWKAMRESLDTITDTSESWNIKSGNKSTMPKFVSRITTKNDDKPFYYIGYRSNLRKGFTFAFQKDDGEDRRVFNPVEIICKTDSLYNSGLVFEMDFKGGI